VTGVWANEQPCLKNAIISNAVQFSFIKCTNIFRSNYCLCLQGRTATILVPPIPISVCTYIASSGLSSLLKVRVVRYIPNFTASYPRRQQSSQSPPSEPQTSQFYLELHSSKYQQRNSKWVSGPLTTYSLLDVVSFYGVLANGT
jgi:hypothetical protein